MRKFALAVAAVAALYVAGNSTAEAAGYRYGVYSARSNGGGFFGRLMDMERRKNAMLLRWMGW
ncbi:MAG: hypothetical protein IT428_03215 [Planctomycetaceae bacterium]|nr:hypothetical protein [Planctomycetaceae bacterium]